MTITLAPHTEIKLKELASREGQDINVLADILLSASVEAAERDFEEACAAIASSLTSDSKFDIDFKDYQAQFEAEQEVRRQKQNGIIAGSAA